METKEQAQGSTEAFGRKSFLRRTGIAAPGISLGNTVFGGINEFPTDNLTYEQTDGFEAVYNGSASAVAVRTPFVTPGPGKKAVSLATAEASVPTIGGLP